MNRNILPTSSKILMKRWNERNQEIHRKKLADIRPLIDSHQPTRFKHIKKSAKKEQILEDRYTEIERENRILLEKMTNIMNQKTQMQKTGGGSSQSSLTTPPFQKRSLNRQFRKKELMKITMENQAFLKRLQDKQPNYNVGQWEYQHKERVKRMKNICQYPYQFKGINAGKNLNLNALNMTAGAMRERPGSIPGPLDMSSGFSTSQRDRSIPNKRTGRLPSAQPDHLIRQAENLDESRVVLFRKGKQLGNGYYIVELSTNGQFFYIAAFDVESDESYLIELQQRKADPILQEFERNYEKLANSLQVLNRRLILLHPKYADKKRKARSQVPPKSAGSMRGFGELEGEGGTHLPQLQHNLSSGIQSNASSSQKKMRPKQLEAALSPSFPPMHEELSPSAQTVDNREKMLKTRHSAKRPRTGGAQGTNKKQMSQESFQERKESEMEQRNIEDIIEKEKETQEEEFKGKEESEAKYSQSEKEIIIQKGESSEQIKAESPTEVEQEEEDSLQGKKSEERLTTSQKELKTQKSKDLKDSNESEVPKDEERKEAETEQEKESEMKEDPSLHTLQEGSEKEKSEKEEKEQTVKGSEKKEESQVEGQNEQEEENKQSEQLESENLMSQGGEGSQGSLKRPHSMKRPGEGRGSRQIEQPVFEEDPDEEEIYNESKEHQQMLMKEKMPDIVPQESETGSAQVESQKND